MTDGLVQDFCFSFPLCALWRQALCKKKKKERQKESNKLVLHKNTNLGYSTTLNEGLDNDTSLGRTDA